jgi:chemotaxis protein methyltransferase CheR
MRCVHLYIPGIEPVEQPLGALHDLVLLRSVLIYFEDETRQRVFQNVAGAVRSGGYLILGASEWLLNVPSGFQRTVQDGGTLWQRG